MGSVRVQYEHEIRRRASNPSIVRRTHSAWCGTPSAAGRSLVRIRFSSPVLVVQPYVLLTGAGVTGRLGRSSNDGKSVIRMLCLGPVDGEPLITWMLPLRGCCIDRMYRSISGISSQALDRTYDCHKRWDDTRSSGRVSLPVVTGGSGSPSASCSSGISSVKTREGGGAFSSQGNKRAGLFEIGLGGTS